MIYLYIGLILIVIPSVLRLFLFDTLALKYGQTRVQFQGINKIRKGYQPSQEFIQNKEGNMLIDRNAIMDR